VIIIGIMDVNAKLNFGILIDVLVMPVVRG
jgi:hypothetical protein